MVLIDIFYEAKIKLVASFCAPVKELYQDKTPHEIASHQLATPLLKTLDYSDDENKLILDAIRNHRNPEAQGFSRIVYESDKLSRACFCCPVESECDWSSQKKNLTIVY